MTTEGLLVGQHQVGTMPTRLAPGDTYGTAVGTAVACGVGGAAAA